ncbi:hypothetical protein HNP73_002930 [Amaricoccus macauensis]|uniref:Transporter n=1 Tax=Amaricoccus macauensis TaxID=57001 RepID=A0A840SUN5_9RHOB|nr:AmiS/UreI family transporter [Amaricoccus macauensis]MBB5222983.1 hypothetical protein [Amaricoccus macauensis]
MLTGLVLLYVGIVLFQNGLWLHSRITSKEVVIPNIFSGAVLATVSLLLVVGNGVTIDAVRSSAVILLFGITFLWVALNQRSEHDGRGLGWYCLSVAILLLPIAAEGFGAATSTWGYWFAICCLLWAILYAMFFLLLVRGAPIAGPTGWMALFNSLVTGFLPGYLLLNGHVS